jgi:phospholipid/cholesterol/gamma-HCH transport system substrate-binding protein
VLTQNQDRLIRLAAVSRPTLETLARYSPEFPCLITGIDRIAPLLDQTFRPAKGSKPELHIVIQVINQPNGYTWPADQPKYDQDIGPNCHGLPVAPRNTTFKPSGEAVTSSMLGIGSVGSAEEVSTVAMITAPLVGQPSDSIDGDLADLLTGPLLRGMQVSLS